MQIGTESTPRVHPQAFAASRTGTRGHARRLRGFLLPTMLGAARQTTGSFGTAFAIMAVAAALVAALLQVLAVVQDGWRLGWRPAVSRVEEA